MSSLGSREVFALWMRGEATEDDYLVAVRADARKRALEPRRDREETKALLRRAGVRVSEDSTGPRGPRS